VKLTKSPGETTIYTVVFDDPAVEANRGNFVYSWALSKPVGDKCTAPLSVTGPGTASWNHSNCEHSPGEIIWVSVKFEDGRSVNVSGPAPGAGTLFP
jgi:hypothetical protein